MTATPPESSSVTNVNPTEPSDLFQPSWLLRNGHIQTLAGTYLFGRTKDRSGLTTSVSTVGEVLVDDGDRLVYHDECPEDWRPGDRVALLLHGLAGSHASPYMERIANQLCRQNVRTFRLDWRGCGAGMSLARLPYHSGRSDDLRATITEVQRRSNISTPAGLAFTTPILRKHASATYNIASSSGPMRLSRKAGLDGRLVRCGNLMKPLPHPFVVLHRRPTTILYVAPNSSYQELQSRH